MVPTLSPVQFRKCLMTVDFLTVARAGNMFFEVVTPCNLFSLTTEKITVGKSVFSHLSSRNVT